MKKLLLAALMLSMFTACGEKKELPPMKETTAPNLTQTPDVGKVEQVAVTASGTGISAGAAINDALKTAVQQVNGAKVESNSTSMSGIAKLTATLDVETSAGKDSAKATSTIQGQAFAEQIVAQSKGMVTSFKVVKTTPPSGSGGQYTVDIEAKIAKFKAPADAGKIKIVVAPLKSDKTSFNIGGKAVPANEVLAAIHQQIVDSLSQTGRFSVLDRQFEGELQNEMNLISSGQAVNTDFAKLGQALSADLVWVGVVNDLAYNKHVRKLKTSDRELVSYSGAWSVSQRMINLATRQILQSTTLQGTPPAIESTTLDTSFDSTTTLANIKNDIVKKATEAILLRTFPISVVERDGNNVVLSQGGQAVSMNARYKIFLQGKEMKDPQTGQSLGNMESECCEVVINRVTPTLSYGVLENVKSDLKTVVLGALQVRESVPPKPPKEEANEAPESGAKEVPKAFGAKGGAKASSAKEPGSADGEKKPGKKEEW